jgi:hypothetical protein
MQLSRKLAGSRSMTLDGVACVLNDLWQSSFLEEVGMNEWPRVVSARSHSILDRLRFPAFLRTFLRHIQTMDTEFRIPHGYGSRSRARSEERNWDEQAWAKRNDDIGVGS